MSRGTQLSAGRRSGRAAGQQSLQKPALVAAALVWAQQQEGVGRSLAASLRMIDATFFACFTRRGQVHRGLAQTVLALETLGLVRLTHHADAAHSLLLGKRRVSDIWITGNHLRYNEGYETTEC